MKRKRQLMALTALLAIGITALSATALAAPEPKEQTWEVLTIDLNESTLPAPKESPTAEALTLDKTDMPPEPEAPAYTEEDLEVLALIIYQEAGGDACSDLTRELVGTVVLNRVADPRFPNTVKEVALAPRQYGRLSETGLVWPERASLPEEAEAVKRAYACAELLLSTGARALPPEAVWQAEFKQGDEVIIERDGLYFCK